jgi:hypothetical protein
VDHHADAARGVESDQWNGEIKGSVWHVDQIPSTLRTTAARLAQVFWRANAMRVSFPVAGSLSPRKSVASAINTRVMPRSNRETEKKTLRPWLVEGRRVKRPTIAFHGAEGGTRTPTRLPSLRPERSASTSSTTSALMKKLQQVWQPKRGSTKAKPRASCRHLSATGRLVDKGGKVN